MHDEFRARLVELLRFWVTSSPWENINQFLKKAWFDPARPDTDPDEQAVFREQAFALLIPLKEMEEALLHHPALMAVYGSPYNIAGDGYTPRERSERVTHILSIVLAEPGCGTSTPSAPMPRKPPRNLIGWGEILDALGRRSSDRDKIKRLNEKLNGPIPKVTQGKQPIVDEQQLMEWWGTISARQTEPDDAITVGDGYAYGRDATVLPEINGYVKKRRSDRKNHIAKHR